MVASTRQKLIETDPTSQPRVITSHAFASQSGHPIPQVVSRHGPIRQCQHGRQTEGQTRHAVGRETSRQMQTHMFTWIDHSETSADTGTVNKF